MNTEGHVFVCAVYTVKQVRWHAPDLSVYSEVTPHCTSLSWDYFYSTVVSVNISVHGSLDTSLSSASFTWCGVV